MIPYNPSSFNSNKTILEQILELKRWLIDHPQYEVYYCNDTALLSPVVNSFSLADVPDNTNMDVGDLVVCNNAVYCTVISIDRDNGVFTAGYGISFKGDTGATGNDGKSIRVSSENYVNDSTAYSRANIQPVHSINQYDIVLFANDYIGYVSTISGVNFYVTSTQNIKGDAGANGVSITGVTIDASGHLIVTLSDGNTIDAGSVISGTGAYVIQLTSYTGTLSADDLAIVNDPSKTCIIDYYENSKHSFYFKDRQITGGWRFSNLDYVEGSQITLMWYIEIDGTTGAYLQNYSEVFIRAENINSYGATAGQVLTANGSNGASWQTPSGSGPDIVTITSEASSGTFTVDEMSKLANPSTLICYQTSNTKVYFTLVNDIFVAPLTYRYIAIEYKSTINRTIRGRLINVNVSSRNWNYYFDQKFVNNSSIDSGSATNGQILTADGNGNTSWQTPSTPSIEGSSIQSTGATSGQVLTADGNNGASWQTPSGSSVPVVTLNGNSGTLTADELDKLQNQNGIILRSNQYYILQTNVPSVTLRFISNLMYNANNPKYITCYRISVTISTRAWTATELNIYEKTTSSLIDSGTATNGQVLTADGNGNASWQTPSGGGSQLYEHNIVIYSGDTATHKYNITFSIINSNSAQLSLSDIKTYFQNNTISSSSETKGASGTLQRGKTGTYYIVSSVYRNSSNRLVVVFSDDNSTFNTTELFDVGIYAYDKVITL